MAQEDLFLRSPLAPRDCLYCGRKFQPWKDEDLWCMSAHKRAWQEREAEKEKHDEIDMSKMRDGVL